MYDLVAARPSRPFHEPQRRVADTGAVATLRGRLQALGLVLSDREQAAYRRTLLWFLLPPVLAVAQAAAVLGDSRDAFPIAAMVVVAVTVVLAGLFREYESGQTPYGRRTLAALRERSPQPRRALAGTGPVAARLGLAVALYGAGVLWTADAGLAAGLKVPPGTPSPSPEAAGGYEEVVSG